MLKSENLDPVDLLPTSECSLAAFLRESGELALWEFHSLKRATYSTNRFLGEEMTDSNSALATVSYKDGLPLNFERVSPKILRYCEAHGLILADDSCAEHAVKLVSTALAEIIQPFHFLHSAVSELVWSCHIIKTSSDEYDFSFSDPAIPFSVFISTPAKNDRLSILRVAESIVHEAMHLQLTLFELCCPLVDAVSPWSLYSPWKRQKRSPQGILHGLYVFYVLRWMWRQISHTTQNELEIDFALRRIIEIDEEVESVRVLKESPALTNSGRQFLQKLFPA